MSSVKQKTVPSEAVSGRYEVEAAQFDKTLQDEPKENIQHLDLKAVFPEDHGESTRLYKLREKVWRRVLDESISEFGGAYTTVPGSSFIQVWFENLPSGAAKAKMPLLGKQMADIFKTISADKDKAEDLLEAQFASKAKAKDVRAAPRLSPELAKLMHEGLPDNPQASLMDLWMTRTTQSIMHNTQPTPFATDIMQVVAKADLSYLPVWSTQNQLMVGAFGQIRNTVPHGQHTVAEPMRQELVTLFGTCFQQTALATKKLQCLGFVSLHPAILSNKNAMELMTAFLRRLSEGVRNNLIFEIKGVPPGSLPIPVRRGAETLAPFCKAFMVDGGAFSRDDYRNEIPKLHACGFDTTSLNLPEVEIVNLVRKYAELYKDRPQKTYIRGITSPYVIKIAREVGITYLNGTAVHGAQKFCMPVRQFPIKD